MSSQNHTEYVVSNSHETFRVKNGVCLECGGAVLNNGAHIGSQLPPCNKVVRSQCGHAFPCTDCRVLPPEDQPTMEEHYKKYLEYIANMAECVVCYPDGFKGGIMPSGFCSKHRDPVLLAQGALYGWNYRGGQPLTPESALQRDEEWLPSLDWERDGGGEGY